VTLQYVTLTLDLYDGQGNPVTMGTATLTPSAELTDTTDHMRVIKAPVRAIFRPAGTPAVSLLATDNGDPAPSGWVWTASFTGVPGNPPPVSFALPFSGGATQYLSALAPLIPATQFSQYVPLSALGLAPSGDTTGATDVANVQGLINLGTGRVLLGPGTFYGNTAVTITTKFVTVQGAGRWATEWKYVGSGGDAWRLYNTDTTGILTGGGLLDFSIDGNSAGPGSAGLHMGDMRATELRIGVRNFSQAGSMNVHFDNQYAWMEECHGYLWLSNGTQNLVFDVSGTNTSTNSFGYSDFTVEILSKLGPAGTGQDGVVVQNGALLYNSRLLVRANFQSSATTVQTNAVVRITGTVPSGHPNAGSGSGIHSCRLDVQAECNTTGSHTPQTIAYGSLSGANAILGCTGVLDFAQGGGAFAASNWTATGAAGAFIFDGMILGDFNLNNATVGTSTNYNFVSTGVRGFAKSLFNVVTGAIQVSRGDFFEGTLGASITISFNPSGAATLGSGQRKTIFIHQAASGGPYTVTWPSTGSPTVTNCTVRWPGGAPVMSAGAGALDVYDLVTYDGATWVGSARQNVT
jgi:hypothetical protein